MLFGPWDYRGKTEHRIRFGWIMLSFAVKKQLKTMYVCELLIEHYGSIQDLSHQEINEPAGRRKPVLRKEISWIHINVGLA